MCCCPEEPTPSGGDAGGPAPGCGSTPCEEPEFHLHLDADRDGTVDDDRTGLDVWEYGVGKKGAIILCNNDGDESRSKSDNEDQKVNTGNDVDEIAPLVIRRSGPVPPADWEVYLEVSPADRNNIRIFESRSAGAAQVLGKGKTAKYKLPDVSFTEKVLGMEATRYAGTGFSGVIQITLRVMQGGTVKNVEFVKVRVAPWMMPNHLDKAEKVFVVNTPDNSRFRGELARHVSAAGCAVQEHGSPDRWMQDCLEWGFASLPNHGIRTVVRPGQPRDLETFPPTLRDADLGYAEPAPFNSARHPSSTFDSTGNLECTPPIKSARAPKQFPFGRIYFGPGGRPGERMDPHFIEFLRRQEVQTPIEVNTNWLAVGHVDEIISFVPAPGPIGFKLLLASPKKAMRILRNLRKKFGSAKMLVGRQFPDIHGARQNAEVTVSTFLTSGIPSLGLAEADFRAQNDSAQAELDVVRTNFKRELGLEESDIIDVPILFVPNHDDPIFADALTAGMVNMLVINKHCIFPKPFGPVVRGKDLFQEDLEKKLKALGLTPHPIDDWEEYHLLQGEVHCGTNTLREPKKVKWWEFVP